MFSRIVLFLALSVQACFALAAEDPVMKNWQKHLANQESYHMNTQRSAAEVRASISMTPEKKANVKQFLDRSGVLSDGSKVKMGSSVTRPANTAKVASTLVDRLKNAKDYAKHVGKASVPSFVGMAVFHGLMEGVGWVMDEGGKVSKPSEYGDTVQPYHEFMYSSYSYYSGGNKFDPRCSSNKQPFFGTEQVAFNYAKGCFKAHYGGDFRLTSKYVQGDITRYVHADTSTTIDIRKSKNPAYSPIAPKPDNVEVTNAELETALKNALESNNVAQAQLIAEAIKAAYTQDNSEGQPKRTNPLIAEIGDDMQKAVDSAFDNPQPNPKNPERPSGYYKITDGEKTIEGYVRPSDTSAGTSTDSESTTTTDPSTGNQTTTGTSSGSLQLPAFCDWAGIVCEWIGWTKEDPEIDEEQEQPEAPSDQGIFDKKFNFKFQFGGSCPPDYVFTWKTKPFDGQHTFDLSWLCKIFTFLGYPLVFLSHCIGFWIFYEAAIRKEFKF